jgi:hypothetical protein
VGFLRGPAVDEVVQTGIAVALTIYSVFQRNSRLMRRSKASTTAAAD